MEGLEMFLNEDRLTIRETAETLNRLSVSNLEDNELIRLGDHLICFPTIIRAVTRHPESNLYGFDNASYYAKVKGNFTPKLKAGQIRRIERIGKLSGMCAEEHKTLAKRIHDKEIPKETSFKEVKDYFKGVNINDVYDGRKFKGVLEGISLVFQCPELIPNNAKDCFGSKWFNVKQFHGSYKYGIKDVDELKDDGRKTMFLEGVSNLCRYLNTC